MGVKKVDFEKAQKRAKEVAEKFASQKEALEKVLFKVYGYKFELTGATAISGFGTAEVFFEQASVQTGSQLGLLGRALYSLDLYIVMKPYRSTEEIFGGAIRLVHHYVDGGKNSSTIGYVKFVNDENNGFFEVDTNVVI